MAPVQPEYAPYHCKFSRRSGNNDHFVRAKGFTLSAVQNLSGVALSIDQKPAEAIDHLSALAKAQLRLLTFGTGQLCRKFATIFAGHHPLQMLDDGRNRSNVFLQRFGAIDDVAPITTIIKHLDRKSTRLNSSHT